MQHTCNSVATVLWYTSTYVDDKVGLLEVNVYVEIPLTSSNKLTFAHAKNREVLS
jgi:hypothetical protein